MTALEVTGRLRPYGIMVADDTARVFEAVEQYGGRARFVGGLVRDALLKRELHDVDIACDLPPEQTQAALEKVGIRVIPTGLKHGTITAITDAGAYEITTLRVDVLSDGRHAEVAFTDSWFEDAKRRDFTFNAIYCDLDGTIYDPFDGEVDLRDGRVRFIGVAENRIAEDFLRILRFFRFQAWFGRPPIDPVGAEACRKGVIGLHDISAERIRDEIFKLLRANSPAGTIRDMIGFGILPAILPQLIHADCLRMMQWLDSTALADPTIRPDPLRRLASLFATDAPGKDDTDGTATSEDQQDNLTAAEQFAQRLRLSNEETDRFAAMIAHAPLIDPALSEDTIRRDLYRIGPAIFRDAVLLAWSTRAAVPPRCSREENDAWKRLLDAGANWQPVELPIKGRDILAKGLAPAGPKIGALLKQAEEYWLDRGFAPDRDELIAYLVSQISAGDEETS
jgi:poly(A) polymerase